LQHPQKRVHLIAPHRGTGNPQVRSTGILTAARLVGSDIGVHDSIADLLGIKDTIEPVQKVLIGKAGRGDQFFRANNPPGSVFHLAQHFQALHAASVEEQDVQVWQPTKSVSEAAVPDVHHILSVVIGTDPLRGILFEPAVAVSPDEQRFTGGGILIEAPAGKVVESLCLTAVDGAQGLNQWRGDIG